MQGKEAKQNSVLWYWHGMAVKLKPVTKKCYVIQNITSESDPVLLKSLFCCFLKNFIKSENKIGDSWLTR